MTTSVFSKTPTISYAASKKPKKGSGGRKGGYIYLQQQKTKIRSLTAEVAHWQATTLESRTIIAELRFQLRSVIRQDRLQISDLQAEITRLRSENAAMEKLLSGIAEI